MFVSENPIPTCQDPGIPQNGYRNELNNGLHRILVFSCKVGYKRIGSRERKCLANNVWSGHQPICKQVSEDFEGFAKKRLR